MPRRKPKKPSQKGKKRAPPPPARREGNVIYTPYFVHWRTGKRVYRKNGGMFRFVVGSR